MSFPLQNKKILVTRSEEQAKSFSALLQEAGATPILAPLLTIKSRFTSENRNVLQKLHDFTWVFLTSANGVKFFFSQLEQLNIDHSVVGSLKIAVVGRKTEEMLQSYGFTANFYPDHFTGYQMITEFLDKYPKTEQILLVCGNIARKEIANELRKQQVFFQRVVFYDTLVNERVAPLLHKYLEQDCLDVYTFTSPSAIKAFDEMTRNQIDRVNVIKENRLCLCIGSTTREKAKDSGFQHILVPNEFTIEGMVEELKLYFKSKG